MGIWVNRCSFFSCLSFPSLSLCFFSWHQCDNTGSSSTSLEAHSYRITDQSIVLARKFELRWPIQVRNCTGEKTKPWTDVHSDLLIIGRIIEDYWKDVGKSHQTQGWEVHPSLTGTGNWEPGSQHEQSNYSCLCLCQVPCGFKPSFELLTADQPVHS